MRTEQIKLSVCFPPHFTIQVTWPGSSNGRALDCLSGGCGFKSHPGRHMLPSSKGRISDFQSEAAGSSLAGSSIQRHVQQIQCRYHFSITEQVRLLHKPGGCQQNNVPCIRPLHLTAVTPGSQSGNVSSILTEGTTCSLRLTGPGRHSFKVEIPVRSRQGVPNASLIQLAESRTLNAEVRGSTPRRRTTKKHGQQLLPF